MRRTARSSSALRIHERKVQFGRALCYGFHFDLLFGRGGRNFACHFGFTSHSGTYHGDYRYTCLNIDAFDEPMGDLALEGFLKSRLGFAGEALLYHQAYIVLGGGLGNHEHVDLLPSHRGEEPRGPLREVRSSLCPAPVSRHSREIDVIARTGPLSCVLSATIRALPLRVEAVANIDRDSPLYRGGDGLRVEHFGTEIGQFRRFQVRNLRERAGTLDDLRAAVITPSTSVQMMIWSAPSTLPTIDAE